ncbi:outer membrane protein assembly factor BamE [Endothiovibrio diazotrophicus]
MRKLPISFASAALAGALVLSACSPLESSWVHRIDIQQGNVVEQEQVDQLKPGMTKRQVRFLLGTPLVEDPFHAQRWDYYYSFKPGSGEREERRLTLHFQDDRLVTLEGNYRPRAPGEIEPKPPEQVLTVPGEGAPREKDEKGFFRGIWDGIKGVVD